MTTTKSHAGTHATANHEETAMKTTKTAHHAATAATNEGESAMTTQPKSPATTTATPATTATSATDYIATCVALLNQVDAAFPKTTLTALTKKHTAKARKGSEKFSPQQAA